MPPESLDQKLARFLRQQRGTQTFAQFARKLGVGESTLHRIENGQQSVTLRALGQILRALHCDYEDVFGESVGVAETPTGEKPDATMPKPGAPYGKPGQKKKGSDRSV